MVGLGVGRALPQTQGLFYTKAMRLHGWAPNLASMYRVTMVDTTAMRLHGWAPNLPSMCRVTRGICMTKPNLSRPSGEGETCRNLI